MQCVDGGAHQGRCITHVHYTHTRRERPMGTDGGAWTVCPSVCLSMTIGADSELNWNANLNLNGGCGGRWRGLSVRLAISQARTV